MQAFLQTAMALATQEILADPKARVFGGGRPDHRRPADAFDIDCGLCEEWAERVRELFAASSRQASVDVLDAGNLTGDPDDSLTFAHVFVCWAERFYDAECHAGVADWRDLPLVRRNASLVIRH